MAKTQEFADSQGMGGTDYALFLPQKHGIFWTKKLVIDSNLLISKSNPRSDPALDAPLSTPNSAGSA